jgi:hypothetical protein
MKGADSITGGSNGFLNIVPALAQVAMASAEPLVLQALDGTGLHTNPFTGFKLVNQQQVRQIHEHGTELLVGELFTRYDR